MQTLAAEKPWIIFIIRIRSRFILHMYWCLYRENFDVDNTFSHVTSNKKRPGTHNTVFGTAINLKCPMSINRGIFFGTQLSWSESICGRVSWQIEPSIKLLTKQFPSRFASTSLIKKLRNNLPHIKRCLMPSPNY